MLYLGVVLYPGSATAHIHNNICTMLNHCHITHITCCTYTLDSGDMDAVVPVTSTRYSLNALKLDVKKPWHFWVDDLGEVCY